MGQGRCGNKDAHGDAGHKDGEDNDARVVDTSEEQNQITEEKEDAVCGSQSGDTVHQASVLAAERMVGTDVGCNLPCEKQCGVARDTGSPKKCKPWNERMGKFWKHGGNAFAQHWHDPKIDHEAKNGHADDDGFQLYCEFVMIHIPYPLVCMRIPFSPPLYYVDY